jgi:hypothetical protein
MLRSYAVGNNFAVLNKHESHHQGTKDTKKYISDKAHHKETKNTRKHEENRFIELSPL